MNVIGSENLQSAVMRKNGEVYELLGELLGECSACDLHMALSLISKMRSFGLNAPSNSIVIQPEEMMLKRQQRRHQAQLLLGTPTFASRPSSSKFPQRSLEAHWNDLPKDLLLKVADSLDHEDRQVLACTCAAWKKEIGANYSSVTFAWAGRRICDPADHTPMVNKVVRGASIIFTAVKLADFRRCELLDSDALALFAQRSCRQLKELDLSGCIALDDAGLIAVAQHCPELEVLHIASCQGLTDASFQALGQSCTGLKQLGACGCEKLTDFGINSLCSGARGLQRVNFGWCEALTSKGISALANFCPNLLSLDLCGCLQVDDDGIAELALQCPGLQSLGLHCCRRLTDSSQLAVATHLRHLRNYNISGCRALSPAAVQLVVDSNPRLHTCGGYNRNVIVAGCLNLLSVSCACRLRNAPWTSTFHSFVSA